MNAINNPNIESSNDQAISDCSVSNLCQNDTQNSLPIKQENQDMGDDFHIENHISPNCKVEELEKQLNEYIFVAETLDEMYVKEVRSSEELQKRVDVLTQTMEELLEEMKYPTATFEEVIVCGVKMLEQALNGDQYDEHRKKAEEAISKGASLTNHRIEL